MGRIKSIVLPDFTIEGKIMRDSIGKNDRSMTAINIPIAIEI